MGLSSPDDGAPVPGDLAGVALVGFDFLVGFALGLGRRHEDAVEFDVVAFCHGVSGYDLDVG
jgi:hypothetical protein